MMIAMILLSYTLSIIVGPSSTYIHGPEMLMPGTDAEYSCTSAESDPAADITVQVTDQDGNIIAAELTKLPKMKGSAGFASALQFKFPVLSHYKSVFMKCDADNGVGQAMSQHVVNSMCEYNTCSRFCSFRYLYCRSS